MNHHTTDVLAEPAHRGALDRLRTAGVLNDKAYEAALRMLRPPGAWWMWSDRLLLGLGTALVLSGVIFFCAYNWAAIGPWLKLGVIQASFLACAVGGWRIGLGKFTGKVCTLAAGVLIGVFLAVFGQIYQTGADVYEMFTTWALLMLGYAVLARFGAMWLLWLLVADVAVWLFGLQIDAGRDVNGLVLACVGLGSVNGLALIAREAGMSRGWAWLRSRWLRYVPLLTACGAFLLPVLLAILNGDSWTFRLDLRDDLIAVACFGLAITMGGGAYYYFAQERDVSALGVICLGGCAFILTFIGRSLFDSGGDEGMLLIFGLCCLGVLGGAGALLRHVAHIPEVSHA